MVNLRLSALALIGLSAGLFMAGAAEASCTCTCVEGKAHGQCTTSFEKVVCPPMVCNPNAVTDKPPTLSMPGKCTVVQTVNPETHAIERQKVCK